MSIFSQPAKRHDALRTDLYQLTMAAAMHRAGFAHTSTFELFTRRLHPKRGYWIAAGLEQALDYLQGFRFGGEQIDYLRSLRGFESGHGSFFERLRELRFRGEVWAVKEGTPVFPWEPILRVTASALEAQLVETYLLSLINFQTLIASKAARVGVASGSKNFVDFGTRRAHGPEAGELVARAAFLAGSVGTSNTEAGSRLGIPVLGTFAHSWVMSFADEDEAFKTYTDAFPQTTTLLIDTYDTLAAARRIVDQNMPCRAVRLDSGDLTELSKQCRKIFDEGGRSEIKIVASNDLNEEKIARMEADGCQIDVYGVGTEMATSRDCPALGGVYKVVEIEDGGSIRHPVKLAANKKSWPGRKQVFRQIEGGVFSGDVIGLHDEALDGTPLLKPVMRAGEALAPHPALTDLRAYCLEQQAALPAGVKRILDPTEYPVTRSEALVALADAAYAKRGGAQ